jgi:hypothetical protein
MKRPHPENVPSEVRGWKGVFPNAVHIRVLQTRSMLCSRNSLTWRHLQISHLRAGFEALAAMARMRNAAQMCRSSKVLEGACCLRIQP